MDAIMESNILPTPETDSKGNESKTENMAVGAETIEDPAEVDSLLEAPTLRLTKHSYTHSSHHFLFWKVPFDVWSYIFQYFYPSQLACLSMVCKGFYEIVRDSGLWLKWYTKIHPRFPLYTAFRTRPLIPSMDIIQLVMHYLIAESSMICEECLTLDTMRIPPRGPTVMTPLPVPAWHALASSHDDNNCPIRLCLECRRAVYDARPEPVPADIVDFYMAKVLLREKYPISRPMIKSIKDRYQAGPSTVLYSEEEALAILRRTFGGDVGIRACSRSFAAMRETSLNRKFDYSRKLERFFEKPHDVSRCKSICCRKCPSRY
ncbi:hypothetical protein EDD21DRAFT_370943 [Dissophora ornata]|nr:hypothetical protein BGZ58_011326 [Dissophora ornata]KAI8602770.1 hypothetical protein EDD21DRAFT_370943 [Dissophora ornata]